MKKSDKLLAKLGQSLDPAQRPRRAGARREEASAPAPAAASTPPPPEANPVPAMPAVAVSPAVAGPADLGTAAEAVINRHLPFAMGAGLIPLPLIDVAAITGIQLKMIAEISALYGVPFAANRAKAIVAALLGGAGSFSLAAGAVGSLIKTLPGAGYFLGASSLPLTAGALTYGVGQVFRRHFESGGTLLDFDPAGAKQIFMEKIAEGRAALRAL